MLRAPCLRPRLKSLLFAFFPLCFHARFTAQIWPSGRPADGPVQAWLLGAGKALGSGLGRTAPVAFQKASNEFLMTSACCLHYCMHFLSPEKRIQWDLVGKKEATLGIFICNQPLLFEASPSLVLP